jgi:hypothetical protein
MAEEFDLSDTLKKVENSSMDEVQKKKAHKRWFIAGSLAVCVIGAFLYGNQNWFAKNDFTEPIPLSENVTRWTSIAWGAEGDFKENHDTKFGEWTFDNSNGNFTNSEVGCAVLFTKTRGDYGNYQSDAKDTANYTTKFIEGQEDTSKTKPVYLSIKGYPEGGIEVLKTYYTGADGKFNATYYRHSPDSETLFLGIITCDTAEALEEVAPYESNGSEIKDLGFWLEP